MLNNFGPTLIVGIGDEEDCCSCCVIPFCVTLVFAFTLFKLLLLELMTLLPPMPVTVTTTPVAVAEPSFLMAIFATLEMPGTTLCTGMGDEEKEGDRGDTVSKMTLPLSVKGT
jgi:hypothetical protein